MITDNIQQKISKAKAAGYSDAQIQTFLKSQGVTAPAAPSLSGNIGADLNKRVANTEAVADKFGAKKTGIIGGALQVAGQAAGALGDISSEVLKTVVPQPIKDVAKSAVNAVAETAPAQDLIQKYDTFKAAHPEAAANLESLGLLSSIIPAAKGAGLAEEAGTKAARIAADAAETAVKSPVKLLGKGLEASGQKIQQTVIRPSAKDIADGFKIENVHKYDLGGSLPETVAKTHAKLNELGQQLSEKLKGSNASVNLNHTLEQTVQNLTSGKTKAFGDNQAITRVLDSLKTEIHSVAGQNGLVDLSEATNVKRGAGTKGAWAYNRPEADASAIEKVYTEFYDVLKKQIEQAAPDGVKELNKQLSELIPIQNAALRRLPVEQRNNALSLTDSIGLFTSILDPKALLLVGASKASKSGKFGKVLTKAGAKLQGK